MSTPNLKHLVKNSIAYHIPPLQDDQSLEGGCPSSRGKLTRKQAVKESHIIKTKSDKDAKNAG